MPDYEATDPAGTGFRPPSTPRPSGAANGTWPELPAELTELAEELAAFGRTVQPARPEFVSGLRLRFEQAVHSGTEVRASILAQAFGRAARRRAPGRGWALPAAVVALSALAVLLLLPRLSHTAAPPPIDRATLVARNAQAWAGLTTLTGTFSTGDGWYYEEWISRSDEGLLRFKRYIRPPARTPNGPQWNVSDGRTEWVVDAGSGKVRVTRDAVPGDFTAVAPNDAMQCTSLALPPGVAEGPAPLPGVLDGHAVYRLSGNLGDGSAVVFWVDAHDALVRRIDRPGLGTVWQRRRLSLDPPLAADIFRPVGLEDL
jgi:hypothetical protein